MPKRRGPRLVVPALAVVVGAVAGGAFLVLRHPSALGAPRFVDITATSGVDHTYAGLAGIGVGGGVAVFDCDGDGRSDLYLAGGARPASLLRNASRRGSIAFAPVPDSAAALTDVTGAYPLDVDGDGAMDLAVLRLGESTLLRGLGDCRFAPADGAWGFHPGPGWATAFSATWEGQDAFPTLAVGRYVAVDAKGEATGDCQPNTLLRPAPAGIGYGPPIPLTPGFCALSMLFSDWARSGRRDLRVSNDRHYYDALTGEEQLWRMSPGEPPRLYTADDGWVQMQIWGMGIASQDLTGDGYPEIYLTNLGPNRLQTLSGSADQPRYRDIGLPRGVNAAEPYAGGDTLPSTAWHPEFEDVNNDGFVDLFVSKGNVGEVPGYAVKDPSNLLLGQPDGSFVEGGQAAGIVSFERARGAALADFDLDGLLDLVVVDLDAPVKVWRNVGGAGQGADGALPMGHWLALRTHQPAPNPDAVGAWLEVRIGDVKFRRELTVGGGHVSGQAGWVHVGLGPATDADVRVTWPDGSVGPWQRATADGFGIIERGASAIQPWTPAP
jgi:hypothetical protein